MAVALVLLTGCSFNFDAPAVHYTTASAALTMIAADWCTTRGTAQHWGTRQEGGFPTAKVIGNHPTPGSVDAWFLTTTILMFAGAQLLPAKYRPFVYTAIAGVEANMVFVDTQVSVTDARNGCNL